jgi:DnaJ-class molecular chaperone
MPKKKPKDFYSILGISHNASDNEIKSAYRSLARKYHPDVNQGNKNAELKFKEINEAYELLSDEKQRYLLDLALGIKKVTSEPSASQPKPAPSPKKNSEKPQDKKDFAPNNKKPKDKGIGGTFSDLFENIMKNVDFESAEKKQPTGTPRFTTDTPPVYTQKDVKPDKQEPPKKDKPPQRGEDIHYDVHMIAEEAIKGSVKTVNIHHTDPCVKCKGAGIFAGSQCRTCEGKGEKDTFKKLDVKIPAGIKNGSRIRISKEGNRGQNDGECGDLYLIIKIYNPKNFEFVASNVHTEIILAPHEAILGAEIKILTIDGFINMKIPPGTVAGQKFRLLAQGLPDKNGERGNHFVKIKIDVPKSVSQREKELYEEIARLSKYNPREYIE